MTRGCVSKDSVAAQKIIHSQDMGLKMYLFIKKNNGEGSDFYYMGKVRPIAWRETTILNDDGKELPIMNFQLELKDSVRDDI